MSLLIDFGPLVVGFAAAVLGVFGQTVHEPTRRLTRNGWIAIVLAGIALAAGVAAQVNQKLTAHVAQLNNDRARGIALLRVQASVELFYGAFFPIDPEYLSTRDDWPEDWFDLCPEVLARSSWQSAARSTRLADVTFGSEPWHLRLADAAQRSRSELQTVLTTYAAYLDSDLIVAIELLRGEPLLWAFADLPRALRADGQVAAETSILAFIAARQGGDNPSDYFAAAARLSTRLKARYDALAERPGHEGDILAKTLQNDPRNR